MTKYKPYEFREEDAYNFARHVGVEVKPHNRELFFKICPYCRPRATKDNVRSFSINLETGQFKCLRASCGVQGNMITLSKDFDFSLGNEIDEYYRPKRQFRKMKTPEKPIEPKPEAITYLTGRGISEEVIKKYQITVQTNSPNILVFPFFDEKGKLQFVKYRKTDYDKEKDSNKEWCEANTKPILFGMFQCNDKFDRLIMTEGQCFDGKAEILTPDGWIAFENYAGQDVLQIDERMQGSFVRPKKYIVKRHIGKMVKCEIGGNYETYTTDDHNLVFINQKGIIVKKKAIEKISTTYKIPTVININGNGYEHWTNEMFALYLAISADGTIDYRKNTGFNKAKSARYARIAISLERKKNRLKEILNTLNIEYSYSKDSKGYASICFHCPEWLTSKYLPYGFATQTSVEQKKFIIEEMVNWDGNRVNNRNQYEYTTILKHNADVMQLIASSCGYMSTIMTKKNGGNDGFVDSYCYKVSVLLGKSYVSTQQFEKHKTIVEVDQRVYCVTVDTGMILVRQNGKISVTGNCDSLSVATAGYENATSVPTGAKGFTWVPYCWDWISRFDEIVVFGDFENGCITLLDELKIRLKSKIKHVREEDYKDCKDANEILQKYGVEQIRKCIENAKAVPIERVIELADVKNVDIFKLEKLKTGIRNIDRLLYGGLPFGGVHLVSGKPGEGKSTLASQIMINALSQGYKCFAYSGELPNYLFKAWMDFQIAGPHHIFEYQNQYGDTNFNVSNTNRELIADWYRGKAFLYDNRVIDGDEKESLIKTVENVVKQYGVRVVLLDNLMTAIDLEVEQNSDKYERQSVFVKKLSRLALRYNLIIILVAHKRKNNFSTNENDEISGSGDITNLALITIAYEKNKELSSDQRLCKVSKNRLFGKVNTDGWILEFNEKSKRIYGAGDDVNVDYGWNKQNDGFYEAEEETPFD